MSDGRATCELGAVKKSADSYLDLAEAAKRSPGRPHCSTVWRWCRRGIKARSGERIRLRHIRAGGRIFIPAEALDEFFRRVAEADSVHFDQHNQGSDTLTSPASRTDCQRQRDIAKAERTLREAGIS